MKTAKEILDRWQEAIGSKRGHCHVVPRYTPGSPAMVDDGTAIHVGEQEIEAHRMAASGLYGAAVQGAADRMGLAGIVYFTWEKGGKVFRYDMLTGETRIVPRRLDHKQIERVLSLRNRKQFGGLTRDQQAELLVLEEAAEMNRQTIGKESGQ